jgi:hypothetical protein
MSKTKSKPAKAVPEMKSGHGGRVSKPSTKLEKTKAIAKSVVAKASGVLASGSKKADSKKDKVCCSPDL